YAQVKAVNHYGISTNFTSLGSTKTLTSPVPSGLAFTASTNQSLSAQWNATAPLGDSYILQVSTSQADFANFASSATLNTNATIGSLSINTTYYGRVSSEIGRASSRETASVPA